MTTPAPTEAVSTEAPTEPIVEEGSGIDEVEGSGITDAAVVLEAAPLPEVAAAPEVAEVAALPSEAEAEYAAIPDAIVEGMMDPAVAQQLVDAMCVDELVNCGDFEDIDYCSVRPGDDNYEMYVPFQKGCRKTCGHCDKNAACPDLRDSCHDETVFEICGMTCRE